MIRGKFRRLLCVSLFTCTALAGCASTETAAPVVERTAVRTENVPVQARSGDTRRSPSDRQSANSSASNAAQSNDQNAQARTRPDSASQSSSKETNAATQATAQPAKQPAAETAARRRPEVAAEPYRQGDWRPEYYTVRKGDTLYGIALDFGQDYRDLAMWNALADPSYIQIGQHLRLFPEGGSAQDSAVDSSVATATGANSQPATEPVPTISDPKAYRAIYTEQAYAELVRVLAGETETTVVQSKPDQNAPVQQAPQKSKSALQTAQTASSDSHLNWEWPAPGKVLYEFSNGPNKKGVGIAGDPGQAVISSAPGKVVYSGSGLRGYGNLIIIKHDATYLSVYAHNSQLLVREGQMVAQGQKIAVMGKLLGGSTGLHFEIRRLGKPIDPLGQLPPRPS